MQRFLISLIIPTLAGWGICSYMIFFTLPKDIQWVLLFLVTLFITLELTLGIILYSVRSRTAPNWLNKRNLLRESMLLTIPPALVVPSYLILRYTNIDKWYTVSILFISLSLIEYQTIRKLN